MSKIWLVTGSAQGLGRKIAEAVLNAEISVAADASAPAPIPSFPSQS